jgi:hypothetical protein
MEKGYAVPLINLIFFLIFCWSKVSASKFLLLFVFVLSQHACVACPGVSPCHKRCYVYWSEECHQGRS